MLRVVLRRNFGGTIRDPFPGNIIPESRWDPVAKNMIQNVGIVDPTFDTSDFRNVRRPNYARRPKRWASHSSHSNRPAEFLGRRSEQVDGCRRDSVVPQKSLERQFRIFPSANEKRLQWRQLGIYYRHDWVLANKEFSFLPVTSGILGSVVRILTSGSNRV
jgi:hypothetical protein